MVEHTCHKCGKIFNKKSTYSNHIKRKTSCVPESNVIIDMQNDIKELKNQIIILTKILNNNL